MNGNTSKAAADRLLFAVLAILVALTTVGSSDAAASADLRAEIQSRGFWVDEQTGRIWAAADNGAATSLAQAVAYCRALDIAGFRDWRLPNIEELQSIFGGPADDRGFRPVAPLKLTGWAWSSTTGREPGESWAFDFGDGGRASVAAGDSGLNRALCVHSPKPKK